jgi:hypothetical protein
MSEHAEKQPAELLRAKRLEIVDDEGKVRAVLGTNEEGVISLSVFDQSARLRASLEASGVPEQTSGFGVFDTNGRFRSPWARVPSQRKAVASSATVQSERTALA